jgi:hypothetical protein
MRLHYEGTEDDESRIMNRPHNKISGNDRSYQEKDSSVTVTSQGRGRTVFRFGSDGRLILKRERGGCFETSRNFSERCTTYDETVDEATVLLWATPVTV